ncbi:MAG TPA: amidohydrolase [Candidatus Polarisedimenticolaceae bacterium]|nr:amidohydrolase [Candidatus Polarisedimenticolaceae bacterium]
MRNHPLALALLLTAPALAADPWTDLQPFYEDLHTNPELSEKENATAAKLAKRLKDLGFTVTEGVGGTGVVGILENGKGPVVMLRTEMDALPIEEKTGLAYASKNQGVMHACGHDVHMSAWAGAAQALAQDKKSWSGTLMMVGQPAEEVGKGAKAMLDDGLFTRFPKAAAAIALHDNDKLPAGVIGIKPGSMFASSDSVDIEVFGRGGHGAQPHMTIDPIVIAAKIVLGLQTLISRENDPFDPAVITVGSIHGGTRWNIIPDSVKLQLTVRAQSQAVRDRLLAGIERIARAEGDAGGAPKPPTVEVPMSLPGTFSDAALAALVEPALRKTMGDDRVVVAKPVMPAEDFCLYGTAGVPTLVMWLGAVDPKVLAAKAPLPSIHSSLFAPPPRPTILGGVEALTIAAKTIFNAKR